MEIKWLHYIPIYIALCEEKSIAGAAKKLNCSNAHVSRQLRQLEDILSVQLIQRTTRQFNLTYDGVEFYKQVKYLLESAEAINEKLCSTENVAGKLRVAASASFGAMLLTEPLAEFYRTYPEIEIEVIFTESPLDLIESGFDVAFYLTDSPPEGYVGHYLRSLHCKPFAHKSYIKEQGEIAHPSELGKLSHILYRNTEFALDNWKFLNKKSKEDVHIKLHGTFSVNLVASMVDAMLSGCGVAMLDEFALSKLSLATRKEVVQLVPNWKTSPILPLYILYPKRQHLPKRTKLFVEFFRNHLNGIQSKQLK
ncbi:LysR family transcriptional regulator [Photobacterium indicum]|uniref:LysR family transcriptional regulator n=1 Tax=Photobacterium indicum TaxID=81447 RepID=A0A2T3LA36_9GAMM|nr:LysR family transcriptional regulator [Photobacterium indicum]PSV48172.1 LysR family transcriptional regulator [Photobacterium indicum]